MEKVITSEEKWEIIEKVQVYVDNRLKEQGLETGLIRIVNMKGIFERKIQLGVNWAAIGSVNIEIGIKFGKVLEEVSRTLQCVNLILEEYTIK